MLVVQVRVDELPGVIDDGFATSVHAGAGGPEDTVTVAEQVTVPPAPVAVPVYVVVTVGDTACVPAATGVTAPIPWLREKVVAFWVVHESVEEPPELMVVGFAVSVQATEGGGLEVTTTVAVHVTVPPAPVAVPT